MIEYVVVKYEDSPHFNYGRARVLGQTGNAYAQATQEDARGHDWSPRASIYWAHTIQDAEALANALAVRHVGTTWVVARSGTVFATTPGPIQRSTFTDAGLLPE
jgi:hypothetical protein